MYLVRTFLALRWHITQTSMTLEEMEADLWNSTAFVDWRLVDLEAEEENDLDEDQTLEDSEEEDSDDEEESEEELEEEPVSKGREPKDPTERKLWILENKNKKKEKQLAREREKIADLEAQLEARQEQPIEEYEEEMTYQQLAQKEAEKVVKKLLSDERSKLERERTLDSVVNKYEATKYKSSIEKYLDQVPWLSVEDATVIVLKNKAPHLLLNGFDEWTRNRISWPSNTIKWHSGTTQKPGSSLEELENELKKWWGSK